MIVYRTLEINQQWQSITQGTTHWTAGASADSGTMANPAERTAEDCKNPQAILVPIGSLMISGVPISRTRKLTQSVSLHHSSGSEWGRIEVELTDDRPRITRARTYV